MLTSSFLINMIYIAAYGGGYCQETAHHVTLLRILLLAAGPLAAGPLPCLQGEDAMGCPRLGGTGSGCPRSLLMHLGLSGAPTGKVLPCTGVQASAL